jgi:anti-sigma factor RsiW
MEGTMPAADRERFERHLRACPHCTRYLAQLRLTIDLTGRLTVGDVESLAPWARSDLLAAFRAYRGS